MSTLQAQLDERNRRARSDRDALEAEYYGIIGRWSNPEDGDAERLAVIMDRLDIDRRQVDGEISFLRELAGKQELAAGYADARAAFDTRVAERNQADEALKAAQARRDAAQDEMDHARRELNRANSAVNEVRRLTEKHAEFIRRTTPCQDAAS